MSILKYPTKEEGEARLEEYRRLHGDEKTLYDAHMHELAVAMANAIDETWWKTMSEDIARNIWNA